MRTSRAPITAETLELAYECNGALWCETAAGHRILKTREELDGERPREWVLRQRRAMGRYGTAPHERQGELDLGAA